MNSSALTKAKAVARPDDFVGSLRRALAQVNDTPASPLLALAQFARAGKFRPYLVDLGVAAQIGVPILVLRQRPEAMPSPTLANLSRREKEVAQSLKQGLSNKEIAAVHGISVSTVKDHVHSILAKSGFRSRTKLAAVLNSTA